MACRYRLRTAINTTNFTRSGNKKSDPELRPGRRATNQEQADVPARDGALRKGVGRAVVSVQVILGGNHKIGQFETPVGIVPDCWLPG